MTKRKLEDFHIKIPEPLINEVDKMVIETGLYSDPVEFVADACRRLVIASKKKEVNQKSHGNDVNSETKVKFEDIDQKRTVNRPHKLIGDI
jgi:Arc/MetJ-type ribon-helix-helix transcriptional regulator